MIKDRYLHRNIAEDLEEKMVFIGGPRQVGKTTLARIVGKSEYDEFAYLNWDNREDRRMILRGMVNAGAGLVVFDEIHKYKKWKNYVKGEFDKHKGTFDILVTGSARLDLYRKGGDSLMGRYHYYRLHPFSFAEAANVKNSLAVFGDLEFEKSAGTAPYAGQTANKLLERLLAFGGFPEPFLKARRKTLRRFHNERIDRLTKEDIRDTELVRDLSALQLLVEILPAKVGALLSVNDLREDIQVSHKTMSAWMDILERFYYHFRIYPYKATAIKSLRKEPKMYLWDWSEVQNDGARLENLVASHLLKTTHFLHDAEGHKAELFFLRDVEGREVDFLVTVDRKPWFAVEVKLSEKQPSKHLRYFSGKLKIPFSYQLVRKSGVDYWKDNVRVISVETFLSGLV